MVGENINVEPLTYNDGSTPIEGTFTVGYGDASTSPIAYNQQPIETKYLLEALPTVGEVSTASRFRLMEKLPGVYATLDRDSSTVSVTYDSGMTTICGDIAQCDWDVQQFLNPGDLLRIGGTDSSADPNSFDGATFHSSVTVSANSPVLYTDTLSDLQSHEEIRIGPLRGRLCLLPPPPPPLLCCQTSILAPRHLRQRESSTNLSSRRCAAT
jgi:hypothetical protein